MYEKIKKLRSHREWIGRWFIVNCIILLFWIFLNYMTNPKIDNVGLCISIIYLANCIFSLFAIIYVNLKIRNHRRGIWKDVE